MSQKIQDETPTWIKKKHDQHLKKIQRWNTKVIVVQLALCVSVFALWEICGRLRWINIMLFSLPSKIAHHMINNFINGTLLFHMMVTVGEIIVGFLLGTVIGTGLAIFLWWFPFLYRVLSPYMVVFNSMPKVALGPLFILFFGAGFTSIVMTTLSITVMITTLIVYNSFNEVDDNYIKVIKSFGGTRIHIFLKVVLPSSVPTILSVLKINVGMAWVGVIVGEFLVAKSGLGYLIIYGFQIFNFTIVFSSLFVIGIIATGMHHIVSKIEQRLLLSKK